MTDIVRLKPLEWEETLPGVWIANTLIGRYRCDTDFHGRYRVVIPGCSGWFSIDHATLDAAKAAAEAHYRKRIAPAFTSPWKPMESAPKDRAIVLTFGSRAAISRWSEYFNDWILEIGPAITLDTPVAWMEIPPLEQLK